MTDETLFDAIAILLPDEQREAFYKRMAYLRQLSPNDELLLIAEAMGFLALLIRETPAKLVPELTALRETVDRAQRRFIKLPEEILKGVDVAWIANQLSEALETAFETTSLRGTARELVASAHELAETKKAFGISVHEFGKIQKTLDGRLNRLDEVCAQVEEQSRKLRGQLWTTGTILLIVAFSLGIYLHKWF